MRHFKRNPFKRLLVAARGREGLRGQAPPLPAGACGRPDRRRRRADQRRRPAGAARPSFDEADSRRESELLERLGERGATGIEQVLPALNGRRVEVLLLDEQFGECTGSSAPSATCWPWRGRAPADGAPTIELDDPTGRRYRAGGPAERRGSGGPPSRRGADRRGRRRRSALLRLRSVAASLRVTFRAGRRRSARCWARARAASSGGGLERVRTTCARIRTPSSVRRATFMRRSRSASRLTTGREPASSRARLEHAGLVALGDPPDECPGLFGW